MNKEKLFKYFDETFSDIIITYIKKELLDRITELNNKNLYISGMQLFELVHEMSNQPLSEELIQTLTTYQNTELINSQMKELRESFSMLYDEDYTDLMHSVLQDVVSKCYQISVEDVIGTIMKDAKEVDVSRQDVNA